ncbi:MAG: hypothetical protein ACYC9W_01095 [Candidatus Limnocylindria bacterium]
MCLSCGCNEPGRARRRVEVTNPAAPEPHELVVMAAEEALERAETWIGWNGAAVMSFGNAWTPHKALRRIADHFVDHLCQIEARASGDTPVADEWRGRSVTLPSDWAAFTEQDLDEATARIRRLAQLTALRLEALREDWDTSVGNDWTIRAIGQHLADAMAAYASRPPATPIAGPSA